MANKKFKIGDIIIGNAKANRYTITKPGWVGEVTGIGLNRLIYAKDYGVNGPRPRYQLDSKCFELYKFSKTDSEDSNILRAKANSSKRILIEVSKEDPTVITAKYIRGKEYTNEEAFAACSKHDIFDFKTGAKIAFDRIMNVIENIDAEETHEEPKKLLNCRFVVTSGGGRGPIQESQLYDGYIYTVRNGKIFLDDGNGGMEVPCASDAFLKSQRDLEWYLGSSKTRKRMRELGIAPDKSDPLYYSVYCDDCRITFKIIEGEING